MRESRYQAALELARSLFKEEPSAAHRELVQKATLGRARELRHKGHTRDAAIVLENAVRLGDDPAWLEQIAEELAANGEAAKALDLLNQVPNAPSRPRVLARVADSAIRQGKSGRQILPPEFQPHFDLILQAFSQAEAGQDEEARASLQGIGLQSPFLEWKVFLRGLLAFYQNDDARVLENWQRLDPERLAARLAAPLRFMLDRDYRAAQPPASQAALQQQADRLQGSGLVPFFRTIQKALTNERQLPQAFRHAEVLLPPLRREAPKLVPRLASCFYWAIVDHGEPEDVSRYRRVFGAPADDPALARLTALSLEQRGIMPEAHRQWQAFEKSVAANPNTWPGEQATHVRALVWAHMGHNAEEVPDLDSLDELPPFLRNHPDRPRPLKPTADECYQRSIELAPDTLEPYEALFEHYRKGAKLSKAIQAGRRLLSRFPDHVKTLEAMADLLMEKQQYAEAQDLYQRAAKANPLERRLRAKLSAAHTYNARTFAEQGRFDEARAEYQAALTLSEDRDDSSVLCKWAACEFKAGADPRAEELLARAHTEAGHRLAVAYSMLIESIRLKLPRPLKNRFDAEFKEALAEPPSGAAALAVAQTAAAHRLAGITYVGQKTHEKKVLTYLEKARKAEFAELQLALICAALKDLQATRLLMSFIHLGQKRFPAHPIFFLMEAEANLSAGPRRVNFWNTGELLRKARELATAMPPDERQKSLLEVIQDHEQQLRALNPFAALFGGMGGEEFFHPFSEMDFDDTDEDDMDEF
jgi:tetratricopeptide (TPR) repeat protein